MRAWTLQRGRRQYEAEHGVRRSEPRAARSRRRARTMEAPIVRCLRARVRHREPSATSGRVERSASPRTSSASPIVPRLCRRRHARACRRCVDCAGQTRSHAPSPGHPQQHCSPRIFGFHIAMLAIQGSKLLQSSQRRLEFTRQMATGLSRGCDNLLRRPAKPARTCQREEVSYQSLT